MATSKYAPAQRGRRADRRPPLPQAHLARPGVAAPGEERAGRPARQRELRGVRPRAADRRPLEPGAHAGALPGARQ
eukprot:1169288-Alexandrium_andersonii.AAC.1